MDEAQPKSETSEPRAAATLAQAARERRDIVSGSVMDEAALIRFVAGPDGSVVPDLSRKLPGRGLWVAADRASVAAAAKKGLFSRAAKTRLNAAPDLADQVEAQLKRRLLNSLGLVRRSGDLISGFEKVAAAIIAGQAAWMIEASDGAHDGRRKLLSLARKSPRPPRLFGLFGFEQLGLALGGENVIHVALLAGRSAGHWTLDVERLARFCPLFPESWREEP
jgi:predicted RNA-binding protein YlxR (DUF448 family)